VALQDGIERHGLRSLKAAMDFLGGSVVDVACAPDAFFNVNSTDDLARAEEIARR
jgi:molybdopterin-guanine dinucleotide biosynthesis protein A